MNCPFDGRARTLSENDELCHRCKSRCPHGIMKIMDYTPVRGEPVEIDLTCHECGSKRLEKVVFHETVKKKCDACTVGYADVGEESWLCYEAVKDTMSSSGVDYIRFDYCPKCGRKL